MELEFRNIHIDMIALTKEEKGRSVSSFESDLTLEFKEELCVTRGVVLVSKMKTGMRYTIVQGVEVVRAAYTASIDYIPCLIGDAFNDVFIKLLLSISSDTINESIKKKPEDVIQQAIASYKHVASHKLSFRKAEAVAKLGKKSTLYTDKRLAKNLDPQVQKFVREGKLSKTAAKYISYESVDKQYSLAVMSIKEGWTTRDIELYRSKQGDEPIINKLRSDINNTEREIEEISGYKVSIVPKTKKTGTIKFAFYGTEQLIDLVNRINKLSCDCRYKISGNHSGKSSFSNEASEIQIRYLNLELVDEVKLVFNM